MDLTRAGYTGGIPYFGGIPLGKPFCDSETEYSGLVFLWRVLPHLTQAYYISVNKQQASRMKQPVEYVAMRRLRWGLHS